MIISSGLWNKSKFVLIKFDFNGCKFEESFSEDTDKNLFVEGATLAMNDQVYQLTYQAGKVLIWDLNTDRSNPEEITFNPSL
mgnify:CR=1 FL=1